MGKKKKERQKRQSMLAQVRRAHQGPKEAGEDMGFSLLGLFLRFFLLSMAYF